MRPYALPVEIRMQPGRIITTLVILAFLLVALYIYCCRMTFVLWVLSAGVLIGFVLALKRDGRYFLHHPFVGLLVFAFAGIVVWFLGRFMNRKPLEVMELDEHGRKVVPKARHTIWFIPAEYWGPILFVLLTLIVAFKA
jgi:hypothetical protein